MKTTCEAIQQALLQASPPSQAVDEHLATCADCREFAGLCAMLPRLDPPEDGPEPPAAVDAAILAAARRHRPAHKPLLVWLPLAAAAAIVLAFLVAGLWSPAPVTPPDRAHVQDPVHAVAAPIDELVDEELLSWDFSAFDERALAVEANLVMLEEAIHMDNPLETILQQETPES